MCVDTNIIGLPLFVFVWHFQGHCNCNFCIGGDTLLFSCTSNTYVPARDVKIGDKVRTLKTEDGSSVCSDVYYVYKHKGESDTAIKIMTSLGDSFTVSYDHIVYVGESFEVCTRSTVMWLLSYPSKLYLMMIISTAL